MDGVGLRLAQGSVWPVVMGMLLLGLTEEFLRASTGLDLWVRLALTLGAVAPMLLPVRLLPVAAVLATSAAVVLLITNDRCSWGVLLTQMLVMMHVARRGPGPLATVLAVTWSCILLFSYTSSDGPAPGGSPSEEPTPRTWLDSLGFQAGPDVVALAALTALAGSWLVRTRRDAARRAEAEEARQDERNAHITRSERARIARELHDVVAHHLSIVAVQAETARLTTPGLSQQGADRFTEIGDTARTALTEMRRLLGVLREDAHPEQPRHPQPGIADISELVEEARGKGGSTIRLAIVGDPPPLDTGTQLTAYRIVQEALTNARRHACGAAIAVQITYSPSGVAIRVKDDGPGSVAGRSGHGLIGLRERVAMVGGTMTADGPPGQGFAVAAVLPATGTRLEQ